MNEFDEYLPRSIGSEGFVDCELERILEIKKEKIEIKNDKIIDKIKNYYNTCCDIDGRPPSKIEFNEFLKTLL